MYSYNDFIKESAKQIEYHDSNLKKYAELVVSGRQKIAKLDQQREDVVLQMVDLIAPTFSTPELERVAKLLHNAGVALVAKQFEEEKQATQKRLDEIDADQEYIKRDILLHPTTGEYELEYKQANAAYQKADQAFAPYKKYTYEFEDLINDKYGTDEYEHTGILRFFNNEHLDNWRIGDILCEEFKEESFLPLREKYLGLKNQLKELYDAADYYRKKIKYIEDLKVEHRDKSYRLPQLPSIYKKKLAQEIDAFLDSTSPESSKAFFGAYPQLEDLAKSQQGLNSQRKYLLDLQKKLDEEASAIREKRTSLMTEHNRFKSSPSKYGGRKWEPEKFKKRFNRNQNYMNSRFDKYNKTQHTIYSFNNYHAAPSVYSDIFWWDLIVGKNKIDGSFSPDVKNYYDTHTHDKDNYHKNEPVSRGDDFSSDNS